jgi:hypothetical protein
VKSAHHFRIYRVLFALLMLIASAAAGTAMAEEDASQEPVTTETIVTDDTGEPSSDVVEESTPADDEPVDDGSTEDASSDGTTPVEEPSDETTPSESTTIESTSFGPMAMEPDGSMVGPTSVRFTVPAAARLSDLATLSANLDFVSTDACQLGSPRFAIGLSVADDKTTDGYMPVFVGDFPGFTGCAEDNPYINGGNLIGATDDRWNESYGGGFYGTWEEAVALAGQHYVTEIMFVVEYGSVTPADGGLVVQFKTPAQELLGDVIVDIDFDATPAEGDACVELVGADESVVGEKCLSASGSVAFEGLKAGQYTVRVSESPDGFVLAPQTQPVTVTAGKNSPVSFDAVSSSMVTLEVTSADPDEAALLPADSTWSVASAADPDTVLDSGTIPADFLDLSEGQTIPLGNPVNMGTYIITIDAEPEFELKTQTVTINQAEQTVEIELTPATDDMDEIVAELVALLIQILMDILEGDVTS